MRERVSIEWIKTVEQMNRLDTFAASFEHKIESFLFPICAVKRGDRWFGYVQIMNLNCPQPAVPLALTAWHTNPEICSPRDVYEAMEFFTHWARMQYGGGMITVAKGIKTFTPEVMDKLGFEPMNLELYELKKA